MTTDVRFYAFLSECLYCFVFYTANQTELYLRSKSDRSLKDVRCRIYPTATLGDNPTISGRNEVIYYLLL